MAGDVKAAALAAADPVAADLVAATAARAAATVRRVARAGRSESGVELP